MPKDRLPNPVIYKQKEKYAEATLVFSPCLVCGKVITDGYYGRWGDGGVCSKTCNTTQDKVPKYPQPKENHHVTSTKTCIGKDSLNGT